MILDGQDSASVQAAAQALAAGELVGLPTETVYGLASDASRDDAVAKIYQAKGRPADHPLIVHVADAAGADHFAHQVPDFARALMQAFWPGPLTLILPRRPEAGAAAAGGQDSVGLRCPSHPVATAVLRACVALGVHGLAAPSANLFGRVSPTTAAHVQGEFGPDLLVLDGGACQVGIESTIVDCTRGAPVLLRPGGITRDQIEAACGQALRTREELASPDPRASGTLEAHYAPLAKVRLMDAQALQTALDVLGPQASGMAVYARSPVRPASGQVLVRRMPDDAEATAQQLFAALRGFDEAGVKLIWVETPPAGAAWEGVRDRLQRAAAA
ncbi:L-threonylcarbamoyladenylate synthase [Curvibacter sp. RS43]|jgi:L-threonylcarbamoyladenylate synthase|uniref:Threonylcarbamoyl-AMP synthase n=1 Tax=Curvibacter microcysteis TaxID=3026419 RepID=A0ABT5MHW4_9BURK|nr:MULTISPECIES: L-threonylcarbamoyladenylate synthase [unclassified Curvibacter]MDD0810874.1 L-threonylcarbamoyladenylate synthase [Curvibacter sp. RS43]MDD0816170.1 L-threonylcarbamoyladenylate synthase [Curvibacter sp. HBC28]